MKFLDQAKIYVKSGKGGNGCVAFRREKYIEFGGPNGGDGGRGGDIVFYTDPGLNTLIDFRYRQHFKASPGQDGSGSDRSGKSGETLRIAVPVGTEILAEDRETVLADLTEPDTEMVFIEGGNGGWGNARFKSSTNRAPRNANPGHPGEERWIWLRLKLLADIGLVGLPNAGKSTFLASVTRARPKIADYPFTTLHPNLGVASLEGREVVIADIPGLIEGAHTGVGLGTRFLGHIERCRVLLHLIDGTQEDVVQAYQTVRTELTEYGAGLSDKVEMIALNKCDAMTPEDIASRKAELENETDAAVFELSGVSGHGRTELLRALFDQIPLKTKSVHPEASEDEQLEGVGMDTLTHFDFTTARRVVVKIGSVLLVEEDTGDLHRAWLDAICDDIAAMRKRGQEVVVVTSGAIAIGRQPLGLGAGAMRLEEKQAAAATGQMRLSQAYQDSLSRHGLTVAQILLTVHDTEDRRRFLNARTTLDTLLRLGAVPLINENDTVATEEIRFGDNDRLAARVAAMISADACILLSDVDGLYNADPTSNPDAEHRPVVNKIDDAIRAMAGTARPGHGTGGMVTKIQAAEICTDAGCHMAIALGTVSNPLSELEKGARCTWFLSAGEPRAARKKWIGATLKPSGRIVIDAGAVTALKSGKSLLPAGVTKVEGTFERGDTVDVVDENGQVLGKGLSAFGSEDAAQIKGRRSSEIEGILGFKGRSEIIHRDDLVLTP